MARVFAAEIELMFYGEVVWSSRSRLATFATAACAAIAAVSVASWYAMAGLQWMGERAKAFAPAKPVNMLSNAAWAGRAEVLDRFSNPGGIVLGELTDPRRKVRFDPAVPKRWGRQGKGPLITLDPAAGNAHSLVFSGSGSFKTAGIAIPNALTFAGSLIVMDPKGEIHAAASTVRAKRGRNAWLVTENDGLDPIRLLTAARPKDGTVFDSVAEFLLPTSGDEKADSSTFFHQKAVRLLSALLGHLYYTAQEGTDLFMAANRMLAMAPEILTARFSEAAEEHEKHEGRDFIHVTLSEVGNTEPRQLSGVTATAANGLSWAGHASTRGFLASKQPDGASEPHDGKALLARVLDDNTDIYFRIPTPVLQANPGIARVLIGSLVRVLRDSAMEEQQATSKEMNDSEGPKAATKESELRAVRPRPASGDESGGSKDSGDSKDGENPPEKKPRSRRLFLIDEARALRRMDTLAAVRDEGRAYGIHLLQIFQSWQQVVECYGSHGAGAWSNSVDAVVIGPVSDAGQAQELTRMVGRHTVTTSSTSRQRSSQIFMPLSGTAGSSESTQLRELDLIQPSELRRLPPEAAIILAVGTPPIMGSKAIWFTRADMTALVNEARLRPDPEKPASADEAPDPVARKDANEEEAVAAGADSDVQDSASPGPAEKQGILDVAVSFDVGDPLDVAAGQGWFQPGGDSAGNNARDDTEDAEHAPGVGDGADVVQSPEAEGSLAEHIQEVEFADLGRVAGALWLDLDEAERGTTVILASADEIRAVINETVRGGLAAEGILRGGELEIHRLIARGMTPAQKGNIHNWSDGDAAVFRSDLRGGKARKGECFTVLAIKDEHAVLAHDDGREFKVKPGGKNLRHQLDLYEVVPIGIMAGDHVRWTRGDPRRKLANGQRARVLGIGPKAVQLEVADGRALRLARDDAQLRHLDHAYSSPVHGAQAIAADQVIAVIDSGHGAILDPATFYAEVCRDRSYIVVLTDNRQRLLETLEEAGEWPAGRVMEADRPAAHPDKEPVLLADRVSAEIPELIADEHAAEWGGNGAEVTGREAVRKIPCTAGLGAAEDVREEPKTSRSLEVLEMAAAWYRAQLKADESAKVRLYLKRRGFDAAAQGRRGFGYAPRRYGALSAAFKTQGVTVDELIEAGLVGRYEKDGSTYDRFRDRIMFPIEDEEGRCIAFGGRAMSKKARVKYLNSPQTRTFDKGRTVYNLGAASEQAAETGVLYLAEGYMDVASMTEAGITNVVAPLGTAVTSEQLELMWQKADRLVAVLDGDEAGRRAAERMIDLALPLMQGSRELAFVSLPEGADPDSMIQSGDDGRLCMLLGEACPLVEELWHRATAGPPIDSPERRAAVDKALKDILAQIPDPAVRDRFRDVLTALDMQTFGHSHLGGQAKDVGPEAEPEAGDDDSEAVEQPPEGAEGNMDGPLAGPEVAEETVGEQPGEVAEDLPGDDCRESGDDSEAEKASGLNADENTVEEVGIGADGDGAAPEAGQGAPSSAIAASIVNRALYTAIIQRSQPARSHPFVDPMLKRPDVEIPPGTEAKVILPLALGKGVEHYDAWSLVFVPDDERSPIHRIVIGTDGTIIARLGPYNAG